jgi:cobalt/nickel transport system permease protein
MPVALAASGEGFLLLPNSAFMTLTLDDLPHAPSPLARLDPRWKLAAVTGTTLAVTLLHTVSVAATALAGAAFLAALARLPLEWYFSRIAALGIVLLLFVVLIPFVVHDGGTSWEFLSLRISLYGLRVALVLCLKALAVVTLVLVLLTTTPLSGLLKAAHALRVPGLIVQLLILTYRYLFVLGAELARLRMALRVRGYRNRASRHSYRTIGHVAGTLLVRGYDRAERVGQAMRCRGFDGQFRSLTAFRTETADWLFAFALLISAAGMLAWDWILR